MSAFFHRPHRPIESLKRNEVIERLEKARAAGEPPNFAFCALPSDFYSSNPLLKDLHDTDFEGAVLKKIDFGMADVLDASFRDADLTDADLSLVKNLLPEQLSGANLTRCKLPDDIKKWEALPTVKELSLNAGKMFLTTMIACIFVALTTQTTGDLALLTNSGVAELPALGIKIPVPITSFFTIAPLVLLILSVTTHLYLQQLWEAMAKLPAVFPDGVTVTSKTFPWLVNDIVRIGFPRLNDEVYRTPLAWVQYWSFRLIAFGTVPLTNGIVFMRCLMRHDDGLLMWQMWLVTLSLGWITLVWQLNNATLMRNEERRWSFMNWMRLFLPNQPRRPRIGFFLIGVFWMVLPLGLGSWMKDYAQNGTPLMLSTAQREQLARLRNMGQKNSDWRPLSQWSEALWRIDEALSQADRSSEEYKTSWNARQDLADLQNQLAAPRPTPKAGAFPAPTPEPSPLPPIESTPKPGSSSTPTPLPLPDYRRVVQDGTIITPRRDWWTTRVRWLAGDESRIRFKQPTELASWQRFVSSLPPLIAGSIEEDRTVLPASWKESNLPPFPITSLPKDEASLIKLVRSDGLRVFDEDRTKYNKQFEERVRPIVPRQVFRDQNLRFLQARGAFLVSANLYNSDLTFADLTDTDLRNALFRQSEYVPIQLAFAQLQRTNLTGANLQEATLTGANLQEATLTGANLAFATFIGTDISKANLTGVNLYYAILTGADLTSTVLTGAFLFKGVLTGANLSNATLIGATLVDTNLIGTNFGRATLIGANLSSAVLTGAGLRFAILTDADLSGAKLTMTDFTKADLRGSSLRGAKLLGTILTDATLTGADLSYATLTGADLTKATLTGADLSNADLSEAKYLETAKLDKVVFSLPHEGKKGTQWPKGWVVPSKRYKVVPIPAARLKKLAEIYVEDEKTLAGYLRMLAIIELDR